MANIKISELNELTKNQRAYNDYVPIVDSSANETKKISVENLIPNNVNLIAVTDTAPSTYETGDKYFNTETNKIYTATGSGWANAEDPISNILYIVLSEQTSYTYDGTTLVSVGGGSEGGGDSTPIGTVEAYAGSTVPNGYLLCDGSAVSRTTYSDLFSVIGTTYGSGDGSTTFNLPNLKGRTVVMQDTTQTEFDTLGETGGNKALQKHIHEGIFWSDNNGVGLTTYGNAAYRLSFTEAACHNAFHTGVAGTGAEQSATNGNLQPYIVLNYIIKANKISQVPTTAEVQNVYSTSQGDVYSCDYVNNMMNYSTTEINTGKKWIDGKPIYRKVIDFGTLPDTSDKTVSHNISNLGNIIDYKAIAYNAFGSRLPVPYLQATVAYGIYIYFNDTDIVVSTGYPRSGYSMYVVLEYTKTTD